MPVVGDTLLQPVSEERRVRCLLLIAISLLVISVYNNLLMRKILFTFKEKDDYYDNFEIEGFITISNIFYIIDTVLILVGLYILYKSFF